MQPLPVPTLDHVVVNTRDQLDAGAAAFRRLGFTLTPRGHHTLGSANHLAVFGNDYLELIGILDPGSPRAGDVLQDPPGLSGLVFLAEDSAATHAALAAREVAASAPEQFSRPVSLAGGTRDAVFRTVHVRPPPAIRPGRIYFCHHLTRDLVWRDEWRHHPNGTVAIDRFVIAARDPAALGALFGRMFGEDALRPGPTLVAGLAAVEVLDHAAAAARFGAAAAEAHGRASYMAGLVLRTRSLARAGQALAAGGVRPLDQGGRLVVRAADAMNCPIEFVDQGVIRSGEPG